MHGSNKPPTHINCKCVAAPVDNVFPSDVEWVTEAVSPWIMAAAGSVVSKQFLKEITDLRHETFKQQYLGEFK